METQFWYWAGGLGGAMVLGMLLLTVKLLATGRLVERLLQDLERMEERVAKARQERASQGLAAAAPIPEQSEASVAEPAPVSPSDSPPPARKAPAGNREVMQKGQPDEKPQGNFIEVEVYNNRTGQMEIMRQEIHPAEDGSAEDTSNEAPSPAISGPAPAPQPEPVPPAISLTLGTIHEEVIVPGQGEPPPEDEDSEEMGPPLQPMKDPEKEPWTPVPDFLSRNHDVLLCPLYDAARKDADWSRLERAKAHLEDARVLVLDFRNILFLLPQELEMLSREVATLTQDGLKVAIANSTSDLRMQFGQSPISNVVKLLA